MENQLFMPHLSLGSNDSSRMEPSKNIPGKSITKYNVFKPKGLTMRSSLNSGRSPYKKLIKPSQNKIDSRQSSSGHRLLLQKQATRFEKEKEMFVAKSKELQKPVTQNASNKPAFTQFEYPQPEVLAHDYDDSVYDFLYLYSPFKNLTVKDEDEGFISDPELLPLTDDLPFAYSDNEVDEDEDEDIASRVINMDFDISELSDLEEHSSIS